MFFLKKILKFGYHFLLCNKYRVLLMKFFFPILTHFGDATYQE